MKKVLVRMGKADYSIPYIDRNSRLIMVTDNPGKESVLVWRMKKLEGLGRIGVREASLAGGKISEGTYDVAIAHWHVYPPRKTANVWHFVVHEDLRRKTIGTAMRELLLRDMRGKGAKYAIFPYPEEKDFYKGRGFRAVRNPLDSVGPVCYGGKISELGIKPKGIKLRVLWKGGKRFAK